MMLMSMTGKIFNNQELIDCCIEIVKYFLKLPAWGNPNKFGYSHNGDMGAALIIKHLSVLYNWLYDELAEIREELLIRIEKQLEIFFEQQLLMSQYWGGAVLQDHGCRSSLNIGFAALNLLGHSKVAEKVLSFYVPRIMRGVSKQPHDGFIPFSQYHKADLQLTTITDFRTAYKFASGIDIFEQTSAFRNAPLYILSALDEKSLYTMICCTRSDKKEFKVGLPFFFTMAKEHDCEISKYLADVLIKHYRSKAFDLREPPTSKGHDIRHVWRIYENLPLAVIAFEDGLYRDTRPVIHNFNYFEDGGALHYRNSDNRFNVAAVCNPNTASFHAVGTDLSGTDMGISNPSMGAFTVGVNDVTLIQTAESGYRTGSQLGNVLLVDGVGQFADNGYPMGVPVSTWRGQRIQKCFKDKNNVTGSARVNLAPVYPDSLSLLTYTRDFYFHSDKVIVRDTVITKEKHKFNYWFNTYKKHEIEKSGEQEFVFKYNNSIINFKVNGCICSFKEKETDVVWAKYNEHGNEPFKHLDVSLAEETNSFVIEFEISLVV
jgi:hypothetical protein